MCIAPRSPARARPLRQPLGCTKGRVSALAVAIDSAGRRVYIRKVPKKTCQASSDLAIRLKCM